MGGDKGYVSKKIKNCLKKQGIDLYHWLVKNMKPTSPKDKFILKGRIHVEHTLIWYTIRYITNQIWSTIKNIWIILIFGWTESECWENPNQDQAQINQKIVLIVDEMNEKIMKIQSHSLFFYNTSNTKQFSDIFWS